MLSDVEKEKHKNPKISTKIMSVFLDDSTADPISTNSVVQEHICFSFQEPTHISMGLRIIVVW